MVDKTEGEAEVREAIAEMEASFPAVGERLHEVIIDSGPELTPRTWYGMRAYARMARSCASSTQCSVESAEGVGSRHSILGSGALPREFRDGLLVEREKIEITGCIDPTP